MHDYVFDAARHFTNTYDEHNYFLQLELLTGHEGTGDVIKYLDESLLKFLKEIDFQKTHVIVFSDHGMHL